MYNFHLIFPLLPACVFLPGLTRAAGKTHIYIDQIPLYTEIAQCARDRLEAIVRNQFSGCGDDQQLTSFACFCIDSSSEFSSIISTAIVQQCSRASAQSTTNGGRQTTAAAMRRGVGKRQISSTPSAMNEGSELTGAMEVWESYCAKTTELARFGPSTISSPATITVTQPPQVVTVAPSSDTGKTPLAAIIVPVIVVPIFGLAALYLYLRHKRLNNAVATNQRQTIATASNIDEKDNKPPIELVGHGRKEEMAGSELAHEMEHEGYRAELEGGGATSEKEARVGT